MTKIGVIGLGMMGGTHLDAYAKLDQAHVIAVADADEERRTGRATAAGNIEGQAQGGFDFSAVKQYADAAELIADPEVELVDICLPTPLHVRFAIQALEAGKHVLIEKPIARHAEDAARLVAAAEAAPGLAMCAMCMRFWPGWDWLKRVVDEQTYGKPLAAHFRRVTSHPGGPFYIDGEQCGGAILDLHIHDSDFVQHTFGMPEAVFSQGYSKHTGQTDHVVTQYLYGQDGPMVSAEGGWAMQDGFGFEMQYTVNFEKATAVFDLGAEHALNVIASDGQKTPIELPAGMGYDHELAYFLDCIAKGVAPQVVTLEDAARSLRLVEAEARSIATGQPATL
ncbi:MAG: Gfo/Idh/MocA family oxidoreductase [Planctomycetota bacterium]